jgi:hypothetical protein
MITEGSLAVIWGIFPVYNTSLALSASDEKKPVKIRSKLAASQIIWLGYGQAKNKRVSWHVS